jgi:RNA polymerase sigma-70 factor, ECF subfamily
MARRVEGGARRASDDRHLLELARRNDPAALRALFERHKQRVAAQIERLTGDPALVDDLVQEVFVTAFTHLHQFREDSQLHTWIYRIALNKVRNHLDSDQRRRGRERRSAELATPDTATLEDQLDEQGHRRRLSAAMDTLPDKLRKAFICRAIEGMSLQEASEVLGVAVSTVSYRARRAHALLCEAFRS